MVSADKVQNILNRYENDYDHFLDSLQAKARHKRRMAQILLGEALQAESSFDEAAEHKKESLWQKAKNLVEKAGGIQGAAQTADNILKWWKTPSDTSVSVGGAEEDIPLEKKKILGMSPIVFYAGSALVLLISIWAVVQLKSRKPQSAT